MIADTAGRAGSGLPWYREPWPWILMAGPVAAVIGGAITAYIAVTHQDGLVAEDYYKQGLAINRTLAKERAATKLGLTGQLQVGDDGRRLRVLLDGSSGTPASLKLRLAHATVAGMDQQVGLSLVDGGWYEGVLATAAVQGKWKVLLEDPEGRWRITGIWLSGEENTVTLAARDD